MRLDFHINDAALFKLFFSPYFSKFPTSVLIASLWIIHSKMSQHLYVSHVWRTKNCNQLWEALLESMSLHYLVSYMTWLQTRNGPGPPNQEWSRSTTANWGQRSQCCPEGWTEIWENAEIVIHHLKAIDEQTSKLKYVFW